jgi:hypothetical protein
VVLSAPDLFGGGDGVAGHTARHVAAFSLAYAAGLVAVVARPARARPMLSVALVLAATLVITAGVDVAEGRVPLVGEAVHLPEVLSVVLVRLLAVPTPSAPGSLPLLRRRPLSRNERTTRRSA